MQEAMRADLAAIAIPKIKLKKSRQELFWIFLFFALLSIAIISPISSDTAIPYLADYMNNLAVIIQAKAALAQGQFPLRIMPSERAGLGYPLYQFYAPTTYTFVGLIYWLLTPTNPLLALKIAIGCGLLLGGLSMYRLAYWFMQSRPAAVLAGVVYLCSPYYIIIINRLGSLSEILALGLLPGVLYYSLQRYDHPHNSKILLQLSLGWYLLFTVHLPTAIYASVLFAILFSVKTLQHPKRVYHLISVGIAYALGCLLAMWFLLPAGLFGKYLMANVTYSDPNYLPQFHPLLSNLLFPAATLTSGYKDQGLMTIHPSVGLPILAAFGICLYAYFNKLVTRARVRRADSWLAALLIIFCIAFFFAWSPINVWRGLPQPLLVAQYCWRLLGQVIWIGALLFSWAVLWLFKGKLDARHIVLGIFLIIVCVNPWFPISENAPMDLRDFIKNPHMIYNSDDMLIDSAHYQSFVSKIDSVEMDAQFLRTHYPYLISKPLIRRVLKPIITVHGNIAKTTKLTALMNGLPISTTLLKAGPFTWNIPLNFANDQVTPRLEFRANHSSSALSIPVQEFLLTGFLPKNGIMDLKQMKPFCKWQNATKRCELLVPMGVQLLELPELYYPDLLKVTLNGQTVHYDSILYQSQLVASVIPIQGKLNIITVEFTGLSAANASSWLGWEFWSLLLLCYWAPRNFLNRFRLSKEPR